MKTTVLQVQEGETHIVFENSGIIFNRTVKILGYVK